MEIYLHGVRWLDDAARTSNEWEDNRVIISSSHGGSRVQLDVKGHLIHIDAKLFCRAVVAVLEDE